MNPFRLSCLLLLAWLPLQPSPLPDSPERVPLARATLEQALDRYAPILVLHKHEKYLPTRVEQYLRFTEPYRYTDQDSGISYQGLRFGALLLRDSRLLERFRAGEPDAARTYVNVKVGLRTTDLQFWFLYAYNGPGTAYLKKLGPDLRYHPLGGGDPHKHLDPGDHDLGELGVHEGDWEHVTVTIDNDTGVCTRGVYLAAHGEGHGLPLPPDAAREGGRLRVYASRNGHAASLVPARSYHATVKAGVVEFRLLNDTSRPGREVDFRGRWEIIGIQGDESLKHGMGFVEPPYLKDYPGRWGRIAEKPHPLAGIPVLSQLSRQALKMVGAYRELTFEAGPYPPWNKSSWTGPE